MAAGLMRHFYGHKVFVTSAGVVPHDLDGFGVAVLEEMGIDISSHEPRSFQELHDSLFDIIISLSPEAQHSAVELTRTMAVELEYWPTLDPTIITGSRDQMMDGYRAVRDGLLKRIRERFGTMSAPVV
jgi:protein-tyrosine-phosphatase